MTSPDVVLLDEPLANLDRHLKQEMEETFREFHQRSGATMIYVTHDQSEAMALATDVAVMSEGRLLQVAPPAEIYARPEGRIVGGLIGRGAILTLPVMGGERHLEWEELQDALQAANTDGADILVRPEDVVIGGEGLLQPSNPCCSRANVMPSNSRSATARRYAPTAALLSCPAKRFVS